MSNEVNSFPISTKDCDSLLNFIKQSAIEDKLQFIKTNTSNPSYYSLQTGGTKFYVKQTTESLEPIISGLNNPELVESAKKQSYIMQFLLYCKINDKEVLIAKTTFTKQVDFSNPKKPMEITTEFIPKSLTELNSVSLKDNSQDSLKQFREMHKTILERDKKSALNLFGLFGFLRHSQVLPDWGLEEIIKHAHNHNNRSREACVKLGWMTKDGELNYSNKELPDSVREAFDKATAKENRIDLP